MSDLSDWNATCAKLDALAKNALNADAIYAALIWTRDFFESPRGKETAARLINTVSWPPEVLRKIKPIPRLYIEEFSDERFEDIYPGERTSVEYGLTLAPLLIFAPERVSSLTEDKGPAGQAVRRFIAHRAH
jgi:hypothetical protein